MSTSERVCPHTGRSKSQQRYKDREEDLFSRGAHILGPSLESKLDELKYEIKNKIEKELDDSKNARVYICQKYDELCNKIENLTELDATVTGFRSDVRAVEKQVAALQYRVDYIEQQSITQPGSISPLSNLMDRTGPNIAYPLPRVIGL